MAESGRRLNAGPTPAGVGPALSRRCDAEIWCVFADRIWCCFTGALRLRISHAMMGGMVLVMVEL